MAPSPYVKGFILKIYFSLCDLNMQQTRTIWTIIKEGHIRIIPVKLSFEAIVDDLFVFVALHAKSTAMIMAGRSVHLTTLLHGQAWTSTSADPEGDLDPPGKSQVIWVSIGNKQLDPPAKRWTPPPPGKCWTPSGTLKNDSFLWN